MINPNRSENYGDQLANHIAVEKSGPTGHHVPFHRASTVGGVGAPRCKLAGLQELVTMMPQRWQRSHRDVFQHVCFGAARGHFQDICDLGTHGDEVRSDVEQRPDGLRVPQQSFCHQAEHAPPRSRAHAQCARTCCRCARRRRSSLRSPRRHARGTCRRKASAAKSK